MSRDVFAWLLAAALIGKWAWDQDALRRSGPGEAFRQSRYAGLRKHPLARAWWRAERERWREEEARQDAGRALRHELPDCVEAPVATWYRDSTELEERRALEARDCLPRFKQYDHDRLVALGPRRPDDLFLLHPPPRTR
jgi:hypothetical protein